MSKRRSPRSIAIRARSRRYCPAPRPEPIDRCFAGDTVETILDDLAREAAVGGADGEWAAQTRAGLMAKSPTSLKVTLRQLSLGRGYDIEAALALEYRLTQHFMEGHDFYEGVRAVVIDKDQMPRWQPATLAEVDRGDGRRLFCAARRARRAAVRMKFPVMSDDAVSMVRARGGARDSFAALAMTMKLC